MAQRSDLPPHNRQWEPALALLQTRPALSCRRNRQLLSSKLLPTRLRAEMMETAPRTKTEVKALRAILLQLRSMQRQEKSLEETRKKVMMAMTVVSEPRSPTRLKLPHLKLQKRRPRSNYLGITPILLLARLKLQHRPSQVQPKLRLLLLAASCQRKHSLKHLGRLASAQKALPWKRLKDRRLVLSRVLLATLWAINLSSFRIWQMPELRQVSMLPLTRL